MKKQLLRIFDKNTQTTFTEKVQTIKIINLDKSTDILTLELTMHDGTTQNEEGSIDTTVEKYMKFISDRKDVNYAHNHKILYEKNYWVLYKSDCSKDAKAIPMPEMESGGTEQSCSCTLL